MKMAISVGDLNGVGLEILLKAHQKISKLCTPIYCIHHSLLKEACQILRLSIPKNLILSPPSCPIPSLAPSKITSQSGQYSYESFLQAISLVQSNKAKACITLPIHKKAWQLAGIPYAGHTQALSHIFNTQSIMVLGSPKLYIALFSDHIPLKEVPKQITFQKLISFLFALEPFIQKGPCGVLGLNPHAGDFGVLGSEERIIADAITHVNATIKKPLYQGPLVPDTAFVGKHLCYYVAMYHDQGLIALKTLYFEKSINLTLQLPIIRTSVDHGTAFDIAYQNKASTKSYCQAIKEAISQAKLKKRIHHVKSCH